MITALEVLQGTRELFEQTHWCQGDYKRIEDGKEKYCAVGGLWETSRRKAGTNWASDSDAADAYTQARVALEIFTLTDTEGGMRLTLINWNDEEGRTVEEVINLFKKAEARVKGEGVEDPEAA